MQFPRPAGPIRARVARRAFAPVVGAVLAVFGLVAGCTAPANRPLEPSAGAGTATPGPGYGDSAAQSRERPPQVTVRVDGTYAWAFLDRATGARYGSANADTTNFSESMIKSWIAADFLRRADEQNQDPPPYRMDQLVRMIRDSSNGAAESIWIANGRDAGIRRLIDLCRLVHTRVFPDMWSQTMISASDAVRMGDCVANGTAAGPQWTSWVLEEMRRVRGTTSQQPDGGRWGIIDALPPADAAAVAIKNGWTLHSDNTWNVNCLAIHSGWILAVMTDYPGARGLAYGAEICAMVARQVLRLGD
jgi:hypothetical protein